MGWPVAKAAGSGLASVLLALAMACSSLPEDTDTPMIGTVASKDGVPIVYDVRGAGSTTIVFVHGWSCDRSYWSGQVDALAGDYRVVTLDLAGHGASGLDRREWTIESLGADVVAVMEALDVRQAILIGHSMGSDVAVDATLLAPERVKGIIWLDQYNELDTQLSDEAVAEIAVPFREDFNGATQAFVRGMFPEGADPALVVRVATDMGSAPPDIAVPLLMATKANSRKIAANVAALSVPVVTINAGNSPTDAAALARRGVKTIVMPGTGHFLMMDDPEGFNALLKQTIAEEFGG